MLGVLGEDIIPEYSGTEDSKKAEGNCFHVLTPHTHTHKIGELTSAGKAPDTGSQYLIDDSLPGN